MRTTLKTMPSETVGQGRIAALVAEIESSQRARDFWRSQMDCCETLSLPYRLRLARADHADRRVDNARAELRELIGVDPYRLASALGA